MAEFKDREHYIPLRKSDLVELLCADPNLPSPEQEPLRRFCQLISAIYHFEYLERLEKLKDGFAHFNPDAETVALVPLGPGQRDQRMNAMFDEFTSLLEKANFHHLDRAAIIAAMEGGSSDWGVNMYVDFNLFDRLEVYVRGDTVGKRSRRPWRKFFRLEEFEVDLYKRFILAVKFKPSKRLPKSVDTEGIYFKLFKDVPKLDIEMLIPGARVQMPGIKKLMLGGSLLAGFGTLVWKLGSALVEGFGALLAGTLSLAVLAPIGALLGVGYKQYSGFQRVKMQYSLKLSESLYYQNLDNNLGVLTHLVDEAEEQECREAILAYYCLWRYAPAEGWTAEQLDDFVEGYLEKRVNLKVDFEIGDAMDKVLTLRIVQQSGDHYKASPLPKALELLDYRWDNYFQYNVGGDS